MNKTYTLEELKLAKAKKCRIEILWKGEWNLLKDPILMGPLELYRIHPADEWKARLPRLKEGAEWHRKDFTNEMLEGGYRPLLNGEMLERYDENWIGGALGWFSSYVGSDMPRHNGLTFSRTRRAVPPEFLHPDELAKQSEAFTKGQKVSVDWHDPHGDGSYAGDGEFIRHLEKGDVGDELLKEGPHVVVKCTPDDSGSIFPMSAVKVIQQASQAPDFGEPWRELQSSGSVMTTNNKDVLCDASDMNEPYRSRAIECVNALSGVPDPAEFVKRAKEMQRKINCLELELAVRRGDIDTARRIEREGGLK